MSDKQLEWVRSKVMFGEVNEEQRMFSSLEERLTAASELAARCRHQNITPMCRAALAAYDEACK